MAYSGAEKITYSYNIGGQLNHVRDYKSYGYDYVNKIGYGKFEQRTYLKYFNGADTFYRYVLRTQTFAGPRGERQGKIIKILLLTVFIQRKIAVKP